MKIINKNKKNQKALLKHLRYITEVLGEPVVAATKRLGEVTFFNSVGFLFVCFLSFFFNFSWLSFTWQKQTHRDQIATEQWLLLLGYFCLYNQLLVCLGISLSNQTVFVLILFLYLNISSGSLRLLRLNRHITHINNKINIQPYQSVSFILNK